MTLFQVPIPYFHRKELLAESKMNMYKSDQLQLGLHGGSIVRNPAFRSSTGHFRQSPPTGMLLRPVIAAPSVIHPKVEDATGNSYIYIYICVCVCVLVCVLHARIC